MASPFPDRVQLSYSLPQTQQARAHLRTNSRAVRPCSMNEFFSCSSLLLNKNISYIHICHPWQNTILFLPSTTACNRAMLTVRYKTLLIKVVARTLSQSCCTKQTRADTAGCSFDEKTKRWRCLKQSSTYQNRHGRRWFCAVARLYCKRVGKQCTRTYIVYRACGCFFVRS